MGSNRSELSWQKQGLAHGADTVNARNWQDKTPLQVAEELHQDEIAAGLRG